MTTKLWIHCIVYTLFLGQFDFLNDCILHWAGHYDNNALEFNVCWADTVTIKKYHSFLFGIATDIAIFFLVKSKLLSKRRNILRDILDDFNQHSGNP